MRIVTYNVEWFTHLFGDDGALRLDDGWSGRHDVTRRDQLEALGIVFTALDADAVMVVEAPDSHHRRDGRQALVNFAKTFDLRTKAVVTGFRNDTQQELTLMYDPYVLTARHDPRGNGDAGGTPRFDGRFRIDLDIDASPEVVSWSKPPLELECQTKGGTVFRMIGVHAKSKSPHAARNPDEVMRVSIDNRRKQLAQCIWLRQRVEEHLALKEPLIVLGDFNDGPGLDEYEKLFGRSGVEIVLGEGDGVRLNDPNASAILDRKIGIMPTSARFMTPDQEGWVETLLDYIMVSPDLVEKAANWRIWHPFRDQRCYETQELREALLTASDHFPVSLDIAL